MANSPFDTLPAGACLYAVGEAVGGGHLFCGDPAVEARPYCAPHCRIAYRAPKTPLEKSAHRLANIDNRPTWASAFRTDIMAAVSDGVQYRA